MSTQTAPGVLDVRGTTGIPFPRIVGVELRKMADTRAGKWLLIAIALITALVLGLLMFLGNATDRAYANFVGATATPQGFLLPVLGVLLVTSEWGQRAALTTFTLVPHRGRIIAAKIVAAVLFGLAAVALALVLAAVATALRGGPDAWSGIAVGDLGKFALIETLGILQGLAFGMLLLNSAAAIVTYFVVPIAFTIVTSLVSGLHDAQPWIDPGTAQQPLFDQSAMSGEQWAQLATTTLLWIVVPMALGAWRMMRAEVK